MAEYPLFFQGLPYHSLSRGNQAPFIGVFLAENVVLLLVSSQYEVGRCGQNSVKHCEPLGNEQSDFSQAGACDGDGQVVRAGKQEHAVYLLVLHDGVCEVVKAPVLERGDFQLNYSGHSVVVSLFLVDDGCVADDYSGSLKFLYA